MTGGRGHGSLWLGPAPPPAPWPSPLPAPEHVALTIYGAAAAAVREPGSPGAAATKAEEARRGRRRPPVVPERARGWKRVSAFGLEGV